MNLIEIILVPLILMGISLFVGDQLGVRRGRKQMKEEHDLEAKANREKESEEKQKLKNSIFNEVEYNEELLNKSFTTNKFGHRKYLYRLFRNGFNNALATEIYNSLSAPIQKAVSSYYGKIDRWNELVNRYNGEEIATKIQAIFNIHDTLKTTLSKASVDLKELLKVQESE